MTFENVGIEAGAGCGKTTRIVADILKGLTKGDFSIEDIVVITFTRKAASELKSRISLKLQEALGSGNRRIESQLRNMGNARISTIHSFCESLLKERPIEAGVDPGFTIIEEAEQETFLNDVYDRWLQDKFTEEPKYFRKLVLEMDKELKTPENTFGRPDPSFLGIIRTALQYRELDLFFPEAAQTPEEILDQWLNQCRPFPGTTGYDSLDGFFSDYVVTLKEAKRTGKAQDYLEELGKYSPGGKGGPSCKDCRDEWKSICEPYLESLTYALRYPEIKKLYQDTNRLVQDFVDRYRRAMRDQGVMDFSEILYRTERLLRHNTDVREYFKNKFSYIFVDEFHDTDPLQAMILFYLAEKKGTSADNWNQIQLEDGKIYVVGDPKQSIYRFRRADIEIYSRAMDRITARGIGKEIFLSTNYRSSEEIIEWINTFFERRIKRPQDGNYQANYVRLKPYKAKGGSVFFVEPVDGPANAADQNADDARDMEARLTASWIKHNTDNGSYAYRDIMVLFRNKTNMVKTTAYLEELNIPYEMVGASSYFGRGEILDIANALNAIANPLDQVSIIAALKGPFFSLSDKELYAWRLKGRSFDYRSATEESDHKAGQALLEIRNLHQKSRKTTAAAILRELLETKGILVSYMKTKRGQHKVLNIVKALELLSSFGKIPFTDAVHDFVDKVEQNVEMPDFSPRTGEADEVQLLTVHKAKGLERKVVYLADATSQNVRDNAVFIDSVNGQVIYKLSGDFETLEYKTWKEKDRLRNEAESERLRYVAATRARENLVINKVLFKGMDHTFLAPFFSMQPETETVKIDIKGLAISPGKTMSKPKPKALKAFDESLKRIEHDIPRKVEEGAEPSLTVEQPSTAQLELQGEPISIQVVYNDKDMDFLVEGTSTATIGTLVHKLLKVDPSDIETAAAILVQNEKSDVDPLQLVSMVKALQNKALVKRLKESKTILREVPIKFKSPESIHYDGNIDLLFEENDGWVLADYKTITVSSKQEEDKLRRKYQDQMAVYCEGLKQLGFKIKEALLISL